MGLKRCPSPAALAGAAAAGEPDGRALVVSPQQRRALEMLAGNPFGYTEAIMLAHGFMGDLIEDLLHEGFATTRPGTTRAGKRQVRIVWVAITDAGRRALAE